MLQAITGRSHIYILALFGPLLTAWLIFTPKVSTGLSPLFIFDFFGPSPTARLIFTSKMRTGLSTNFRLVFLVTFSSQNAHFGPQSQSSLCPEHVYLYLAQWGAQFWLNKCFKTAHDYRQIFVCCFWSPFAPKCTFRTPKSIKFVSRNCVVVFGSMFVPLSGVCASRPCKVTIPFLASFP